MGKILTLHSPRDARGYYLSGTWAPDTLYALLGKHATARPDAFALRDPQQRLDWSDLLARVDQVAEVLAQSGLLAGDRVGVWLPSCVETVIVFLACSRNGYVCAPSLHESYTTSDVAAILERVACRAIFFRAGFGADVDRHDTAEQLQRVSSLRALFSTDPPSAHSGVVGAGVRPFPRGVASTSSTAPSTDPDQVVYLAFTSGTTGEPKGVMHSDNTLLANGRALVSDWSHDEHSVILTLSPMSHHIGVVAMQQQLVAGCELVLTDRHCGIAPIDWIEQTGATYVMGVPTHAIDLLDAMDSRGRPGLGRVSVFYMAGAPIARAIAARFLQLGITPQNVYGMTENGSHQYTRPTDNAETITGTCGVACSGYAIRLWKPDAPDIEATPGEVGEIGGRGGLLTLGYFSDQTATERAFNASGWFMSGDLGRLDAHGNLEVVGRKKDLINRGGHKVYPARLEELAQRHPNVAQAAAFGVDDDRLGERICLAFVAQGRPPSVRRLLDHLARQGISRFEMPEYVVEVAEFPFTPSGKLFKREILNWIHSGRIGLRSVASALQTEGH